MKSLILATLLAAAAATFTPFSLVQFAAAIDKQCPASGGIVEIPPGDWGYTNCNFGATTYLNITASSTALTSLSIRGGSVAASSTLGFINMPSPGPMRLLVDGVKFGLNSVLSVEAHTIKGSTITIRRCSFALNGVDADAISLQGTSYGGRTVGTTYMQTEITISDNTFLLQALDTAQVVGATLRGVSTFHYSGSSLLTAALINCTTLVQGNTFNLETGQLTVGASSVRGVEMNAVISNSKVSVNGNFFLGKSTVGEFSRIHGCAVFHLPCNYTGSVAAGCNDDVINTVIVDGNNFTNLAIYFSFNDFLAPSPLSFTRNVIASPNSTEGYIYYSEEPYPSNRPLSLTVSTNAYHSEAAQELYIALPSSLPDGSSVRIDSNIFKAVEKKKTIGDVSFGFDNTELNFGSKTTFSISYNEVHNTMPSDEQRYMLLFPNYEASTGTIAMNCNLWNGTYLTTEEQVYSVIRGGGAASNNKPPVTVKSDCITATTTKPPTTTTDTTYPTYTQSTITFTTVPPMAGHAAPQMTLCVLVAAIAVAAAQCVVMIGAVMF